MVPGTCKAPLSRSISQSCCLCHRLWAGATSRAGACPGSAERPLSCSSPVQGRLPEHGTGAMGPDWLPQLLGLHWGMTSTLITAGQLSAGQRRTSSFLRLWQDKGAGIPMGDSGSHSLAAGACPGPGVVEQLECSHSHERVVHGELKKTEGL